MGSRNKDSPNRTQILLAGCYDQINPGICSPFLWNNHVVITESFVVQVDDCRIAKIQPKSIASDCPSSKSIIGQWTALTWFTQVNANLKDSLVRYKIYARIISACIQIVAKGSSSHQVLQVLAQSISKPVSAKQDPRHDRQSRKDL